MTYWTHYFAPENLHQFNETIRSAPQPLRLAAGGTDILLDLQQGRIARVASLVDITGIAELNLLRCDDAGLFIGAGVPLSRIRTWEPAQRYATALTTACGLIGGPQVRNTATLGGNVAHALPAADGSIALHALGAQAEVFGAQGQRRIPIQDLYASPGKTTLQTGELIVGFWLDSVYPDQASAFRRIMRPQGVALPILNTAVWLRRQAGRILDLRVAVGPAGPTPYRAANVEDFLRGREFSDGLLTEAAALLAATAIFRNSPQRASAAYRRQLCGELFKATFCDAWFSVMA